ncbi:MAG: phage tail tape measure protein, partial [Methanobrevibacter sp.]|nr:phage tail tape measure protein [Methanobrevibacter sp.]
KKLLKTLNTDFSNISKTAQGSMKNAGQAVKKGVETNLKQAKKAADDVQKSFEKIGKTKIDKPLNQFNQQAQKSISSATKLKQTINDVGRGFKYAVGAHLAMQGRQAFQDFGNIDFETRGAAAKTGGFEGDRKKLLKLAQDVGAVTKFRNLDVAQAINAGATLGLKEMDLQSVIPSSAKLAQAFNAQLEPTIESTIAYMKTYGLTAQDVPKLNDMIAVTARDSAADLGRLSEGFKYVGQTAKSMNIPIESVFAILGKMNDVGIVGSSAGTSFNNFLVQLTKNADKVQKLTGKKLTDESGKLRDVTQIYDEIIEKAKTMDDVTRNAMLFDLFGIRGAKNIQAFLNQGVNEVTKFRERIKNSGGAVDAMASFMMAGSGGAIEIFLSTLESAFQSTFSSLGPLIVPVAGALTLVAKAVIKINEKMPYLGQMLAMIASFVIGKSLFVLMAKQIGLVKAALSGAAILKMLAFAAVFMIIYEAMKRFKKALENDKEAAAQWQKVIENAKGVLKELANVILDVIKAMFGFGEEKNKLIGDGPNKNPSSDLALFLNDVREALRKTQEKLESFRKWVKDHKEDFKDFGDLLKDWAPAILGLAAAAIVASGPLGVVVATVGVAFKLENDRRKANKDFEEFLQKNPNKNGLDFIRDRDNKKKTERLAKNPNDWRYMNPTEELSKWWNNIDWDNAIGLNANALNAISNLSKKINYVMFGGLASDLGTKVGEKINSINWGGVWDSVVNIAKNIWNSFVIWIFGKITELKERFPILAQGLNAFHNALEVAKGLLRDIMNFSGKVITITLNFLQKGTIKGITNDVIEAGKKNAENTGNFLRGVQQEYTGTDYFSGGLTTINEKGDELIMGPSGMIVANNPSTMNIMSKLSNLESQTSQMRFRMNEGSNNGGNNITINIANVSNKSDVDYLISQMENFGLS